LEQFDLRLIEETVQEKAVTFPTDGKLYNKGRELLVAKAQEDGINLRQTYSRLGPRASIMQGRYGESPPVQTGSKRTEELEELFWQSVTGY